MSDSTLPASARVCWPQRACASKAAAEAAFELALISDPGAACNRASSTQVKCMPCQSPLPHDPQSARLLHAPRPPAHAKSPLPAAVSLRSKPQAQPLNTRKRTDARRDTGLQAAAHASSSHRAHHQLVSRDGGQPGPRALSCASASRPTSRSRRASTPTPAAASAAAAASSCAWPGAGLRALCASSTNGRPLPSMRTSRSSRPAAPRPRLPGKGLGQMPQCTMRSALQHLSCSCLPALAAWTGRRCDSQPLGQSARLAVRAARLRSATQPFCTACREAASP